jgi:hypothetical protein
VRQHCARRAQQASPECPYRTVLGVLPSVRLQLPDDPPGLLHSVSCLLEAVAPGGGGAREEEAGADSQAPYMQQPSSAAFTGGSSGSAAERIGPVRLRLTVFAAGEAAATAASCGCVGWGVGGRDWMPLASNALPPMLCSCLTAHLFAAPPPACLATYVQPAQWPVGMRRQLRPLCLWPSAPSPRLPSGPAGGWGVERWTVHHTVQSAAHRGIVQCSVHVAGHLVCPGALSLLVNCVSPL